MLLTNPAYLFILVWTIWTAILKYNMYLDPIPNQLTRWNTAVSIRPLEVCSVSNNPSNKCWHVSVNKTEHSVRSISVQFKSDAGHLNLFCCVKIQYSGCCCLCGFSRLLFCILTMIDKSIPKKARNIYIIFSEDVVNKAVFHCWERICWCIL